MSPERLDWYKAAACLGMDTELFFPSRGGFNVEHAAKEVCASCPVRQDCLEDALASEVDSRRFGIRGGLTPTERERLRSPIQDRQRRSVAECGSEAGYYRHIRTIGEPACRLCKEAHAAYQQIRRDRS